MANRLLELRQQKGKTQQEIADYLHISRQAYANVEKGTKSLTDNQLHNLAVYYNQTTAYLLGETADEALEKRFKELKQISARYNPSTKMLFYAYEIALIVATIILSLTISWIFLVVLAGFMAVPIFKYFEPYLGEVSELAERAGILMHQCLQIKAFPDDSNAWESMAYRGYSDANIISLYNKFVRNFPTMQSENLLSLSKCKLPH